MKIFLGIMCLCILALCPFTLKAQSVTQVSQDQGIKQSVSIKTSPGKLNVVYDSTLNGLQSIFYQQSVDGGVSYLPAVRVGQPGFINFSPDVAVSPNGTIYVVWSSLLNQERVVYMSRSTNNGINFSVPTVISSPGQLAQSPQINVAQNGRVYVSYFSGISPIGIYVTSFTDPPSLIPTRPVLVSAPGDSSARAGIVFDSQQNVYIAFGDSNTGLTYLVTSNNNGASFSAPKVIAAVGSTAFAPGTTIAIDVQDNIFVAGNTGPNNGFSIFVIKSTDRGKTFGTPQIIPNSGGGVEPAIAISRKSMVVSWTEATDPLKIASSRSNNGGLTFGPKTILSTNTANRSFTVSGSGNQAIASFSWISESSIPGSQSQIFSVVLP